MKHLKIKAACVAASVALLAGTAASCATPGGSADTVDGVSASGILEFSEIPTACGDAYCGAGQIGDCGSGHENTGPKVEGTEALLWSAGILDQDLVDGVWDGTSTNATKFFQGLGGLQVDGCAGGSTFAAFQRFLYWEGVEAGPGNRNAALFDHENPAVPGRVVRLVQDQIGTGCWWFEWNGWKSFSRGAVPAGYCLGANLGGWPRVWVPAGQWWIYSGEGQDDPHNLVSVWDPNSTW